MRQVPTAGIFVAAALVGVLGCPPSPCVGLAAARGAHRTRGSRSYGGSLVAAAHPLGRAAGPGPSAAGVPPSPARAIQRPQPQRPLAVRGPATEDAPEDFDGEIVVPFSPETLLSGVSRLVSPARSCTTGGRWSCRPGSPGPGRPRPAAPRRRRPVVPRGGQRAVVGEHSGGYLPLTFDITEALRTAREIRVVVRDPTDTGHLSRGKQRLARGGIWYTPQSGIWQTVWIERARAMDPSAGHRPRRRARARDTGADAAGVVTWPRRCRRRDVARGGRGRGARRRRDRARDRELGRAPRLALPDARRWSPEDPFLYDLEVRAGEDEVRSYAGMRSFGIGPDAAGLPRLLLNGEPYFHAGVLDQGYWSDGMYTPPSDEALVHDIATMKRLGFTMLRKHIKIEPLRWYYHCDRLGMLVWQDMVNGGGRYNPAVISVPAVASGSAGRQRYRAFARADPRPRALAGRDAGDHRAAAQRRVAGDVGAVQRGLGAVRRRRGLRPGPRAGPLPDGRPRQRVARPGRWGPDEPARVRPALPRAARRRRTGDRALALTEYGGYSLRLPEHSTTSREFGYRRFPDAASLADAFTRLHARQITRPSPRAWLRASTRSCPTWRTRPTDCSPTTAGS